MYKNEEELKKIIEELHLEESETGLNAHADSNEYIKEQDLKENDGFIEVRKQQIFVINPTNGGKYPVLLPNPNLHITVNGYVLKSKFVVTSKDIINVSKKVTPDPYYIKVSENKLSIFLQVNKEFYQTIQLKDQRRSNQVMLDIEAIPADYNVEETSVKIMEDILKRGIMVEVNISAIMQELINPTYKSIMVAEGLPLIPSVDTVIEKYFSDELEEVIEEVDGKTDFKNRLKIPDVTPGKVIAKIYPPKEGEDGLNVYGEVLRPKPPKKIDIIPKMRVRLTDSGEVIALQHGRPTITGQSVKYIDIVEVYEINNDVDMKTGNIFFHGDIVIRGHVKDNMKVESSGSIYVFGNVYHAKLIASQDIHIVGTVISSKIIAGQLSMFYSQIFKKVQVLSMNFEKIVTAMDQLQCVSNSKGHPFYFNEAFSMLFEMKFKHVIKDVLDLDHIFKEMPSSQIGVRLRILLNTLSKYKNYHTLHQVQSISDLTSVQFSIKELIEEMESMIKEDSSIHLKSANLSTLKANGEVVIKGDGVVQSHIFAGTNIILEKKNSSIKGGSLEALKKIKAGIVGSEMGKAPELYAGEVLQTEKIYRANVKMPYYSRLFEDHDDPIKLVYNPKSTSVNFQ